MKSARVEKKGFGADGEETTREVATVTVAASVEEVLLISVETEENIKILSECRNKAIFNSGFLDICDRVLVIESDVFFRPRAIRSLLNFNTKHNIDADIVTSMHLWDELSNVLYDTYGTRHTSESKRDYQKKDWKQKDFDEYWCISSAG